MDRSRQIPSLDTFVRVPDSGPFTSETFLPLTPVQQPSFPKLPPELRVRIWSYNLPGPRIVSIRCGAPSPSQPSCSSQSRRSRGCTSPAPIPVNLHICHESRTEALKTYTLAFGIARQPGQVYFDFERDVLYFGPRDGYMASEAQFRTALTLIDPAELAAVRRLAISEALFCADRSRGGGGSSSRWPYQSAMAASLATEVLMQVRARMLGLQELVFVPHDGGPAYGDDAALADSAVVQGLARQVRSAVGSVRTQFPEWCAPPWRVMTLGGVPDPPAYGREAPGWAEDEPSQLGVLQESIKMRFAQMEQRC